MRFIKYLILILFLHVFTVLNKFPLGYDFVDPIHEALLVMPESQVNDVIIVLLGAHSLSSYFRAVFEIVTGFFSIQIILLESNVLHGSFHTG